MSWLRSDEKREHRAASIASLCAAYAHAVPRISIVIPTYNSEGYVGETIDSILAQTFQDWELVVFDDGSTDHTLDVVKARDDERVHVVAGENGGVASARNRGFAATDPTTEFVVFLDNDDIWEPELLSSLVEELDRRPDYVSAHSIAICIDEHGVQPAADDLEQHLRNRLGFEPDGAVVARRVDEPTTFADLAHSNWIVTPGLHLVRRAVLEKVGPYDAAMVPCDDWDMNTRVSRHGTIGYVDRPLLRWRRHSAAQSYLSGGWTTGYFRVRHKLLVDPSNTPAQLRAARRGYRTMIQQSTRAAVERARQRDYRGGLAQLARATRGWARYLTAEVGRLRG